MRTPGSNISPLNTSVYVPTIGTPMSELIAVPPVRKQEVVIFPATGSEDTVAGRVDLINRIVEHRAQLQDITIAGIFRQYGCNITALLNLLGSTMLGKGAYGTVYAIPAGDLTFILKRTAFREIGSSPNMSEHVEVAIFKFLNQIGLQAKRTPHIPLYIGDFGCVDNGVSYRYLLAERAQGPLEEFLPRLSARDWQIVIFQVIWTLAVLQHVVPGFRHNDLHFNNILMFAQTPSADCRAYRRDASNVWYVPTSAAFSPALWDFGLSNIAGTTNAFLNRLAKGVELLNYGMGTTVNRGADLARFLYSLYQVVKEPQLQAFIRRVLPGLDIPGYFSPYYAPVFDYEAVVPEQLLFDDYFADFRRPTGSVLDEYSFAGTTDTVAPIVIRSEESLVDCQAYRVPQFMPRSGTPLATTFVDCLRSDTLPSVADLVPNPSLVNYYRNQLLAGALYQKLPLPLRANLEKSALEGLNILYDRIIRAYLIPPQWLGPLIGYLLLKAYYYLVRYWFLTDEQLAAAALAGVADNVLIIREFMLQIDSILRILGAELSYGDQAKLLNNIELLIPFLV